MSHEDIVFNGNIFVDNLKLILRKDPIDSAADLALLESKTFLDGIGTGSAGFLSMVKTNTNPFVDWDGFVTFWKSINPTVTVAQEAELLDDFVADFRAKIGYIDDPSGDEPLANTDWSILAGDSSTTDSSGFPNGVDDALIVEYFKRSFSHFLGTYPYIHPDIDHDSNPGTPDQPDIVGSVGDATTAGDNFFTKWNQFMTRTAEFDDSTTGAGTANVDFAAYEQIYRIFFPPVAGEIELDVQARYVDRVRSFWKGQALENGAKSAGGAWFIPSQSFDEWFEQLRGDFILGSQKRSTQLFTTSSVLTDPVTGAKTPSSEKILVIDRILRLLILMIDILQRISASQAQRLTFLTTWQQAYTELIVEVPQFTQGDGTPLGEPTAAAKAFRNKDVNPHMQSILEKVRARRSAVQDEAKALQTTINQTQDAVNQQTQMATSILQQLSTILSQIFR